MPLRQCRDNKRCSANEADSQPLLCPGLCPRTPAVEQSRYTWCVRRKGARADQPILATSVYVPAQAGPAVRPGPAFICLVSCRVALLAEETVMRYILLGDWQARRRPRSGGRVGWPTARMTMRSATSIGRVGDGESVESQRQGAAHLGVAVAASPCTGAQYYIFPFGSRGGAAPRRAGASSAKMKCAHGCADLHCDVDIYGHVRDEKGAQQRRAMCPGQTSRGASAVMVCSFDGCAKVKAGRYDATGAAGAGYRSGRGSSGALPVAISTSLRGQGVVELTRRGGRVQASGGRKRALPGPDGGAVGQGGERPEARRRHVWLRLHVHVQSCTCACIAPGSPRRDGDAACSRGSVYSAV